jgi:hypothetical protein
VEALEGEELCLVVPPLNLHGARPSGGVLETTAGDVVGWRGAGCRWRNKGSSVHERCRALMSKG